MIVMIALGVFILVWVWVAYEIWKTPTIDEFGNIEVDREDIDKDLFEKEE
tara:strand:+ start:929 stop:1078 length:150 start_codon:yes stop_codon:yes gene_type:complete